MSPVHSESITSLTDYDDLKIDQGSKPELFTLAPEPPKEKKRAPRKLSQEAQQRMEAQQAEALKVFREIPQEIEEKYGNMVLERVFPELQMDAPVIAALKRGERVRSNVTGELLNAAELRDHWILPRGEQISKSTGAIYFPEKAYQDVDMRNSFLFWEFENVKKLLDSKDPVAPKVGIDTERGDISEFEKAYIDKTKETPTDEYENQEMELASKRIGEDWKYEGDFGATDDPDNVRRVHTYKDPSGEPNIRVSERKQGDDVLYASIAEPYIPRHPESETDNYIITRSETDSKLPEVLQGEGSSIAEKLWNQVGPFFPEADAARHKPEALINKYPPVLISGDLIILKAKNPETYFKYIAFAKVEQSTTGGKWQEELIREGDFPGDLTQWLAGLEKRDNSGKHLSGYDTAALSVS